MKRPERALMIFSLIFTVGYLVMGSICLRTFTRLTHTKPLKMAE